MCAEVAVHFIGLPAAAEPELLRHVGDIDVAGSDVFNQSANRLLIGSLCESGAEGSKPFVRGGSRNKTWFAQLCSILCEPGSEVLRFLAHRQIQRAFLPVLDNQNVIKCEKSVRNLHRSGVAAVNILELPAEIVGEVSEGAGDQRQVCRIFFAVLLQPP